MPDQLRTKTLHGLFWSFFERIGQQGIQFVIQIFLARLLLPEQFGLIAMLTIFMAVAQSFLDSGFGSALIQKQDATRIDESSIFYFNIVLGFVAAGLLSLAAPWIGVFYNTPELIPLTRVLSLNLIINSFGLVQTSLMTKRVDFKTQMKISMTASLLSGTIGVILALRGFGVWSLVAQSISANVFRTILLWVFNSWRPVFAFRLKSLAVMFSFGSKLLLSGLLDTLFNNIYLVVIGKVFSAADLGFYSRAKHMQQLPVRNITGSVGRVTFPVFSSLQGNKIRLKNGLKKALKTLAMVNIPLMIGLSVVSKPVVLVLLTEKWLPCVPYLQWLCIIGILYPMHAINLNVLKAQGRSDLFFRLEIIKKVLAVIVIFITYRWGIMAMIYGQLVTSVLAYYLNSYYTGKLLDYQLSEQVLDILPTLGLGLIMGSGVYLVGLVPIGIEAAKLSLQILTGVVLYAGLCHVFKLMAFKEMVDVIRPRFLKLCKVS